MRYINEKTPTEILVKVTFLFSCCNKSYDAMNLAYKYSAQMRHEKDKHIIFEYDNESTLLYYIYYILVCVYSV